MEPVTDLCQYSWMHEQADFTRLPTEISSQVSQARAVIERHLASTLLAVHLYGSTLAGGLKPHSDIDLLVTVTARPDEAVRRALLLELLAVSAPPGESESLRALEVTVLVQDDIRPWRYPARRELQFGEWLREDLLAGTFEPATLDADLAILLTQARQNSLALLGPVAADLFDPVPRSDLFRALADVLELWNAPQDWAGDERNVLLTLARIGYSAATGEIAPKDVAADWMMARLPVEHQPLMLEARQAYLGQQEDRLALRGNQVTALVLFLKDAVTRLLHANTRDI